MRSFAIIILSCFLSVVVIAETQVSVPHQLIEKKSQELIELVKTAKGKNGNGYYYTDPDRYFNDIGKVIGPMVDFSSFSRGVMGQFGTRKYYSSLKTIQEKEAFKRNYKRFINEFKSGLINTYGKGLMAFNGQTVKVEPPKASDWVSINAGQVVDVVQNINDKDKGKNYQIIFKMRPDRKGRWLLRNIIINKINLGELYKKQFQASMLKYNNDFAQVIDNWLKEIKTPKKGSN